MATVKDIAQRAEVSPSTVSIILSGKADQRHISQGTRDKVLQAARDLGYRPNIAAKRLRTGPDKAHLIIALYWASDFRTPMLARFLKGVTNALEDYSVEVELVIHTYRVGHLQEDAALRSPSAFHAAILGSVTREDLDYLESRTFPFPIVLYNRHSSVYPSVTIDDVELGRIPAEIFAKNDHKRAAIIASETRFAGMDMVVGIDVRSNSFLRTCAESGIGISSFQTVENSMAGGYMGCRAICSLRPLPDCIFCASDYIAIGALRALHEQRVRVPEDIEIIAVGNGSKELEEYACPSLSVVVIPMEEMAQKTLHLAMSMLENREAKSCTVPVWFVQRESCLSGEPSGEDAPTRS